MFSLLPALSTCEIAVTCFVCETCRPSIQNTKKKKIWNKGKLISIWQVCGLKWCEIDERKMENGNALELFVGSDCFGWIDDDYDEIWW